MSTPRLSDPSPVARETSFDIAERVSLLIKLTAAPSASLTGQVGAILRTGFGQPHTFLGGVGKSLTLDLRLSDPGLIATEQLAKRLLKLPGVKSLRAERTSNRRGAIYAISLKSPSGRDRSGSAVQPFLDVGGEVLVTP